MKIRVLKSSPTDTIRQFFLATGANKETSEGYWYLLTALRGPDNQDSALKRRTVARLRAALWCPMVMPLGQYDFPLPDKPARGESPVAFADRLCDALRSEFPDAPMHFLRHYAYACEYFWRDAHPVEEGEERGGEEEWVTKNELNRYAWFR